MAHVTSQFQSLPSESSWLIKAQLTACSRPLGLKAGYKLKMSNLSMMSLLTHSTPGMDWKHGGATGNLLKVNNLRPIAFCKIPKGMHRRTRACTGMMEGGRVSGVEGSITDDIVQTLIRSMVTDQESNWGHILSVSGALEVPVPIIIIPHYNKMYIST